MFKGDRILYGHDSFDNKYLEGAAQKRLENYQPGSRVTVHYNPWKPRDAVLEAGINAHTYLYVLLSAGILAAGIEGMVGASAG